MRFAISSVRFLVLSLIISAGLLTSLSSAAEKSVDDDLKSILPGVQTAKKALENPHFPDRMHAFIWRNWTVVPVDQLAEVLGTDSDKVTAVAQSMGLSPQGKILPEWKDRGYITVLRRNWHLLPYKQLLVLLDKTPEELACCLEEDDFLFIKLGSIKPYCEELVYTEPTPEVKARAAEIKKIVETELGGIASSEPGDDPRFSFIERLSSPLSEIEKKSKIDQSDEDIRFIYSYFATFGDPLMDDEVSDYSDGLLERLAHAGVNGVWMHAVLRTLSPCDQFPEMDSSGYEKRLANLRTLVNRAKNHGINVYLYMNEPRAMGPEFFKKYPHLKGSNSRGNYTAFCTSNPEVRKWLSDSLAYVFTNVPDLGGVFTITASENQTSCASHHKTKLCEKCKNRTEAEVIAEVNATIEEGVHRGNPDAKVICWDWGWSDQHAKETIDLLPKSCYLQSVSEWSLPIERGGVKGHIGEYSISAVGPGPRATRHWKWAKEAGLKTLAKVQFNNTWEIAAVPYIPAMDLIAEHADRLAEAGTSGMMLSWSLGGHPSPNLEIAQMFSAKPKPDRETVLNKLATKMFGPEGAAEGRKAWTAFSNAFKEFPYGGVLYSGPQHVGPANPLYLTATGYPASMVGIPYDALNRWRGHYLAEVFIGQFEKIAAGWDEGLGHLREAVKTAPAESHADAIDQLRFAEALGIHFKSVANQSRFVMARNLTAKGNEKLPKADRDKYEKQKRAAVLSEIELAKRLMPVVRAESRIGYEASNHYWYLPIDLAEKVINGRWVLEQLDEKK
jgi:hypothetical protein